MIGLGSNRLTVCRRGGMSVTQARKGGMEWLAGGRWPSWASPYSAQATAALKAQFPTQWPTIRDYGFAHPSLVPFINEDPMLVCSLMELGKIRWITSDKLAYINTEIYMQGSTFQIDLTAKINTVESSQAFYYGARNVNNGGNPLYFGQMSSYHTIDAGSRRTIVAATSGDIARWQIGGGNYKLTVNGIQKGTGTYSTNFNIQVPAYIFGLDTNGYGKNSSSDASISEVYIKNNGTEYRFVPFKKSDNTCCMLDLMAIGTSRQLYYTNYNTTTTPGSFTISETPAS